LSFLPSLPPFQYLTFYLYFFPIFLFPFQCLSVLPSFLPSLPLSLPFFIPSRSTYDLGNCPPPASQYPFFTRHVPSPTWRHCCVCVECSASIRNCPVCRATPETVRRERVKRKRVRGGGGGESFRWIPRLLFQAFSRHHSSIPPTPVYYHRSWRRRWRRERCVTNGELPNK
jgi:hypothetical protein